MYWLGRPRYLRWAAAVMIFGIALFAELRPTNSTRHPFAAAAIERGDLVTAIDWREVPSGLLPLPELEGTFAAVDISEGEPLLPSHLSPAQAIPSGWWSVPVAMAFSAPPGTRVQLVDTQTQNVTDGVIAAEPPDDPFAIAPAALIAVPPEAAAAFAVAAATGQVTVLIAGA